jgi:CRISPR-associated protein Cas8a1/Csx13
MKDRFNGERDRWRFAFAGAKTPEQIRAALAELWSRAGPNGVLRARWEVLLPLLRAEHWETARDLALVALASYQGSLANDDTTASDSTN